MDMEEKEMYDNSMQIGGDIHEQSDIVKKFKHLPKDVKYAYFDKFDHSNFVFKSKTYQSYRYMKKIIIIAEMELQNLSDIHKQFYNCRTELDLKEYFKLINKFYLWEELSKLPEDDKKEALQDILNNIKEIRGKGIVPLIYTKKSISKDTFKEYLRRNNLLKSDIDDFGLIDSMMTTVESSKARGGKERLTMNSTINITKDESVSNEVEEKPEQTNSFSGFFKSKKNNKKNYED